MNDYPYIRTREDVEEEERNWRERVEKQLRELENRSFSPWLSGVLGFMILAIFARVFHFV